MSLGRELDAGLAPGPVRVDRDGAAAEVDVDDVDRLGVRVRRVRVAGASAAGIRAHVDRLPEALRVLPERIVPVEVAPTLGGAVLRSDPAEVRDREYFEVRTDGRAVDVERVRSTDAGRSSVGFTLTREQLRRLVDALEGSFGDNGGDVLRP